MEQLFIEQAVRPERHMVGIAEWKQPCPFNLSAKPAEHHRPVADIPAERHEAGNWSVFEDSVFPDTMATEQILKWWHHRFNKYS